MPNSLLAALEAAGRDRMVTTIELGPFTQAEAEALLGGPTLPQLYDYYVFHTDGEPSLSADDPERFKRSLRRYSRLMRVMQSIRSIFATRSTSPIPRQ